MPTAAALRRLPLVPLAGIALLLVALALVVGLGRSQAEAARRVTHTVRVQASIGQLMERIRGVESAHRGYLISPDPIYARDLEEAGRGSATALREIARLTTDNPRQAGRVARLRPVLRAKLAFAQAGVELRRGGNQREALAQFQSGRGRMLMEAIDHYASAMMSEEDGLLRQRAERAQRLIWWFSASITAAALLLVVLTYMTLRDAQERYAAMVEARDEARLAADRATAEMAAREAAESQLRQLQKMESIGQLTGGIAHDFNNMLAIIIGSLDLARRRLDDRDRVQRAIDNAREGAERAAALTGRLLAFSRQQPLAPVPLDVNRLVSNASELFRRTLGEQIGIETVLAGGLWRCYVDPGQLENALLNLAVNARDAMPDGGKLTIETANAHLDDAYAHSRGDVEAGQYVLISVTDTGAGMTPEVIERAFDPFFTTKGVGKGTGLGLSQVFGFVKQTGGHVAIYSEVGEGTTVKVYLPRFHGPAPEDLPMPSLADDLPEGRAEEVILVVEDEQRVRHFSVDALRELGYGAVSARDGIEALRLLDDMPHVALLFTDIVMPEMNGRRLAEEARTRRPDLKILYTTGYTRNAVVHNGMLDAGVAFLPKPFTIAQLARKVREVIDGGGINRPV